MGRIGLAFSLMIGACSCVSIPDSYAPPVQRKPVELELPPVREYIRMSDPIAMNHVLNDVATDLHDATWRWTGKRAALRFRVKSVRNRALAVDLTIAEETLRDTGPVTIRFLVNNRELDKVRYDTPGPRRFEKPVPPEWLKTDFDTLVAFEIDKLWISKLDGQQFGFILTQAGFVETR